MQLLNPNYEKALQLATTWEELLFICKLTTGQTFYIIKFHKFRFQNLQNR